MPLCLEGRFRDLLDRYEKQTGEMLAHRRAQAEASAGFLRRFEEVARTIIRPCLKDLTMLLRARGLNAYVSDITTYDRDTNKVEERIVLVLPADSPAVGADPSADQPGLSVVADSAARQVRLVSRSLARPGQSQRYDLALLEQRTPELIEEDVLRALEFVCFDEGKGRGCLVNEP
ncbi:MAG TPA: hypothetical protein VFA18_17405 [Gemmataceae bacterium]|nr:hypothetical protein [Gemmataceae bacterium]